MELKLACHLNLATCKFKVGKYHSCNEITSKVYLLFSKVLTDIDQNNAKALFLKGQSLIHLRQYEESVRILSILVNLKGEQFEESLNEAKRLMNEELQKKKNIYKKMVYSSEV